MPLPLVAAAACKSPRLRLRLNAAACLGAVIGRTGHGDISRHNQYLQRLRQGVAVRRAVGEQLLDVRVARAATQASRLLHEGAVVGEVHNEADLENVERWRQGEARLATHEALRSRFRLREASKVVEVLDALYRAAIRLGQGKRARARKQQDGEAGYGAAYVGFAGYATLYCRIHRLLIEDYKQSEVDETIRADWEEEMARCHPGCSVDDRSDIGLTREAFGDSLFELCDLWCASIDADEYVRFLRRLLDYFEGGAERVAYDAELAGGEVALRTARGRSKRARAEARFERRRAVMLIQAQRRGQRARRESEERRKALTTIQRAAKRRRRRPRRPAAAPAASPPAVAPAGASVWLPDYDPTWWPPTPWQMVRQSQQRVAPSRVHKRALPPPPPIWPDAFGNRTFRPLGMMSSPRTSPAAAGLGYRSARPPARRPLASDWLHGLHEHKEPSAGEASVSPRNSPSAVRYGATRVRGASVSSEALVNGSRGYDARAAPGVCRPNGPAAGTSAEVAARLAPTVAAAMQPVAQEPQEVGDYVDCAPCTSAGCTSSEAIRRGPYDPPTAAAAAAAAVALPQLTTHHAIQMPMAMLEQRVDHGGSAREPQPDVLVARLGLHERQRLVLSSHGALKLLPSYPSESMPPSPPASPRRPAGCSPGRSPRQSPRTPRPGGWRPSSTTAVAALAAALA